MTCAVISDVHANLEALGAVLGDIERRKIQDIIFLGDAVGYGPNPNECIELLKGSCKIMLGGNHDGALTGFADVAYFNEYARLAIEWTDNVIKEENLEMLRSLPMIKILKKEDIFLVHSTPKEPEEWHYLISLSDAEVNFQYFEQKVCLLGHTHHPSVIESLPSGEIFSYKEGTALGRAKKYIINAGSVGQPRDRDPRACYVLIDGEKVAFVRVEYDIEKTQKKMQAAGLPLPLIERLARGM